MAVEEKRVLALVVLKQDAEGDVWLRVLDTNGKPVRINLTKAAKNQNLAVGDGDLHAWACQEILLGHDVRLL